MKKTVQLVLFLLLSGLAFSQNEGMIWYFGDQRGLDFSSGNLVELTDGAIQAFQGCAVANDADGNLLFYTNGGGRPTGPPTVSRGAIWNRNHQPMYNMQGIEGGGLSAAQSSIIIPRPGSTGRYLLFTMEESEFDQGGATPGQPQGRGLSYFEIDMALNGGLGGVTLADQRLHVPAFENLTAILHSNGQDYWIITVDASTNDFLVFLVNSSGIQPPLTRPSGAGDMLDGPIKAAPNGQKLHILNYLYDFDPSNGQISNGLLLPQSNGFSASFSHNSRYFYTGRNSTLSTEFFQYDLQAPNIPASRRTLAFSPNTLSRGMQLAPDGKIYFLELPLPAQGLIRLSAIECPNTDSPTLTRGIITYEVQGPGFGTLPNFPEHLFADPPEFAIDLGDNRLLECLGDTLILDAERIGARYQWSTGDTTAQLIVNAPGLYAVTVSTDCAMDTDSVLVELGPNDPPQATISGDTVLCVGASGRLTATVNEASSFLWSTGDTLAEIEISEPGTYSLTLTDFCGGMNTVAVVVEPRGLPTLSVEGARPICPGESISLTAVTSNATSVQWTNGTAGNTTTISTPGNYTVIASNACFELDTTVNIEGLPLPKVAIEGDSIICPGEEKVLMAITEDVEELRWANGQRNAQIAIFQPGTYTVEASNGCGTASASAPVRAEGCPNCFYVPNAFSPNDDGRNDTFGPFANCEVSGYRFQVFSRWGALVFEAETPGLFWDGRFNGELMQAGTYGWALTYQLGVQAFRSEGGVTLVR